MTTGVPTREAAEPRSRVRPLLHRSSSPPTAGPVGATSLRAGVERGMVAILAAVTPLLVLQSLPAFLAGRSMGSPLSWVSLLLVITPCVSLMVALLRPGLPDRGRLLLPVACFLLLVVFERFEIRVPVHAGFAPWLAGIACITVACIAIAVRRPPHAAAAGAGVIAGMAADYIGAVPTVRLAVDIAEVVVLSASLIAVVGVLRHRANRADAAKRAAQEQFERSRRDLALEEERVRTDALLHDSVLTTLLVAAAEHDAAARTAAMARRALAVVSVISRETNARGSTRSFERAILAAERDLAPLRDAIRFELSAARAVELPVHVADALVSAMVQALGNSITHAGPRASRVARAVPTAGGGVRITVRDDGRGFDPSLIAPERLGVRVSIIERLRLVDGAAEVRSAPGHGTTVVLTWSPPPTADETDGADAASADARRMVTA